MNCESVGFRIIAWELKVQLCHLQIVKTWNKEPRVFVVIGPSLKAEKMVWGPELLPVYSAQVPRSWYTGGAKFKYY